MINLNRFMNNSEYNKASVTKDIEQLFKTKPKVSSKNVRYIQVGLINGLYNNI